MYQRAILWLPSLELPSSLLQPSSIDTRGFKSLLDLVDNTTHDSFDLYYGLFMYNQVGPPAWECVATKPGARTGMLAASAQLLPDGQ